MKFKVGDYVTWSEEAWERTHIRQYGMNIFKILDDSQKNSSNETIYQIIINGRSHLLHPVYLKLANSEIIRKRLGIK